MSSQCSPLSAVYAQFHESIRISRQDYERRLREYAKMLDEEWDRCLRDHVVSFAGNFSSTSYRLRLRRWAEDFFGTTIVPFVAIDGSCASRSGESFVIVYGGAYGSRGTIEITGGEARIAYRRWELSRDVSVVAFIPVPLEFGHVLVGEGARPNVEGGIPAPLSDREIASLTVLDTRVMQLAEVFLAFSLARSGSVEAPQLIMMDTTLSGWLANTSFGPRWVPAIDGGKVGGYEMSIYDLYVMLAHPLNESLDVPAPMLFQPHLRLIAEADWHDTAVLRRARLEAEGLPSEVFRRGAEAIDRIGLGRYEEAAGKVELSFDPKESWDKCVRAFEKVCEKLFKAVSYTHLTLPTTERV